MNAEALQSAIEELAALWRRCGLEANDVVMIHSSASRTLRRYKDKGLRFTPTHLLESFKKAVAPDGTLIFPLWNHDFSKGKPFDLRSTPSEMGALTEAARVDPEAIRTKHPIYSVAVIGRHAPEFKGLENFSGYGADSPFAKLHQMNGKIAILDVIENDAVTFYHYVEEMKRVPYRYDKTFTGPYTDESGETTTKTFGLFVRFLEPNHSIETDLNPMGEILWEKGIYQGDPPKIGSGLRVARAVDVFNETARVIDSGRAEGILYHRRS